MLIFGMSITFSIHSSCKYNLPILKKDTYPVALGIMILIGYSHRSLHAQYYIQI